MKTTIAVLLLAFSWPLFAQDNIEEKSIQNFYTTCRDIKLTALNYKNLGLQSFFYGRYEKSIEHFKTSLDKDASLCDSWYLIGYSYQQMGKYEKSIESCNRSLELNPWSVSAYIIKGYSHLYMNNTMEAIKNFEKAKEIDPRVIDPYYALALIKYHQEDYDSARSEIAEFMAIENDKATRRDYRALNSLEEKLELID